MSGDTLAPGLTCGTQVRPCPPPLSYFPAHALLCQQNNQKRLPLSCPLNPSGQVPMLPLNHFLFLCGGGRKWGEWGGLEAHPGRLSAFLSDSRLPLQGIRVGKLSSSSAQVLSPGSAFRTTTFSLRSCHNGQLASPSPRPEEGVGLLLGPRQQPEEGVGKQGWG